MAGSVLLAGVPVFAQVVESGGFTAASAVLGLTPSAVSRQVSQLEDRLGARLLNRTTRRISLTEIGAAYYERARAALDTLAEAEQAVVDLSAAPSGVLKISMPSIFGSFHIAPILPDFVDRHPDITLEVSITDRFVDLVEEGLDVAVRVAELRDSSLVARRIAPFRRLVCASPQYVARCGRPESPDDLNDHDCLVLTSYQPRGHWQFGPGKVPRSIPVTGRIASNSVDVLLRAAMAGTGLVQLPSYVLSNGIKTGALLPLLTGYEADNRNVYAVYPASRHLSPKVRAFVDFLAEILGRPSYWEAAGLQ